MDLRVAKTLKSLNEAFTQLLGERPYSDISVAALCSRAMIRRTTFYKHFADKDDYFAFFLESIRDELEGRIGREAQTDVVSRNAQMLEELLAFLKEHEGLADNTMGDPSALALFDAIGKTISADLERVAANDPRIVGLRLDPSTVAAFLTGGTMQMVRRWWEAGRSEGGEQEMAQTLRGAIGGFGPGSPEEGDAWRSTS